MGGIGFTGDGLWISAWGRANNAAQQTGRERPFKLHLFLAALNTTSTKLKLKSSWHIIYLCSRSRPHWVWHRVHGLANLTSRRWTGKLWSNIASSQRTREAASGYSLAGKDLVYVHHRCKPWDKDGDMMLCAVSLARSGRVQPTLCCK